VTAIPDFAVGWGDRPDFWPLRLISFGARYGVATVSMIDKIIGVFCRISSLL